MSIPSEHVVTVGVPAVSKTLRLFQVASAVFACLFAAGVVFGFTALKPILVRQGVYAELCTPEEIEQEAWTCSLQDLKINYMFTLAFTTTNLAALPVGLLLDRFGPRWTTILGAILFAAGNLTFGLQYQSEHLDTYYIGFVLLALGGPCIFIASFHLANTFPASSGLVLGMLTGGFDSSSVPYALYNILDLRLGTIPIRTFFWSYTIVPAVLLIQQITFGPSHSYSREEFDSSASKPHVNAITREEEEALDGSTAAVPTALSGEELLDLAHAHRDPVIGALFGKSATHQIKSSWFMAITFFLCIYGCRINFFIQTVQAQMIQYTADETKADGLTTLFTILLPIGGVAAVLPIAYLLDRRSSYEVSIVFLIAGVIYGLLGLSSFIPAQIISMSVFVILRPLMYTFVGDFSSKVYGFASFGAVYGLSNTISGVVGMVLRPIDVLVKGPLRGDHTPVNLMWLALGLLASVGMAWRTRSRTGRVRLE